MEMPRLTAAHEKLAKFAGSWVGEETMHPSLWAPQGGIAQATVVNRLALGGFVVVQDYEQRQDGAVTFQGHGVLRWDPASSEYVMHWFDSMGMPPNEFRGSAEGDLFTLTSDDPNFRSRGIWDFSETGRYRHRMEAFQQDGTWKLLMEGAYTRQDG